MEHILAALMLPNRLAIEVSLVTGLRIGDVLNLRTHQLKERFTVREQKTGKNRSIRLPKNLLSDLRAISGHSFVFEHRYTRDRPRTRQSVYKDVKRAARLFRIKKLQISPHTARKVYAVSKYQSGKSLKEIKSLFNHSSEAVTMVYALADALTRGEKNLP
jgi:integrase